MVDSARVDGSSECNRTGGMASSNPRGPHCAVPVPQLMPLVSDGMTYLAVDNESEWVTRR